jgi:predicted alpha/beta superfamily hydrolase
VLSILHFVPILAVTAGEPVHAPGMQGLGDTRHHVVHSESLDKRYELLVGLPDGYMTSPAIEYPTVYVLDGGALYPMFRSYLQFLQLGGDAPELILVGISYGTNDWQQGNDRSHDYTAPTDEREFWGGAKEFQAFLADELIPFVESEYRSRSDRRVLFGRSLGGQFVLYSAQTEPELFWGRIASNPALHRNLPLFLSLQPPDTPVEAHLFVSSAAEDDPRFREPALEWMRHWAAAPTTPWRLHTETLEGHGHFSTPAAAFRAGIRWLFAD